MHKTGDSTNSTFPVNIEENKTDSRDMLQVASQSLCRHQGKPCKEQEEEDEERKGCQSEPKYSEKELTVCEEKPCSFGTDYRQNRDLKGKKQ